MKVKMEDGKATGSRKEMEGKMGDDNDRGRRKRSLYI